MDVAGGRLAYDDVGEGPLIVAVPGMGDLRSAYRFLSPKLVQAGYRVVTLDVRGHGETSVKWNDYSVGAIASDILTLVQTLEAGPAHIIGNSMAAGAAVVAAAREPQAVRSLTLVGPFVRNVIPPWIAAAILGPLLGGPWRAALWNALFRKAFPARLPDDFAVQQRKLDANLAEPGRFAAFRRMAIASKIESERRIADVRTTVLVVMGSHDSDFPDPAKEAQHVADLLRGTVCMIDGSGHYPQAEFPDAVAERLVPFLRSADVRDDRLMHAS